MKNRANQIKDIIGKFIKPDMLWVFGSGAASQLFGFIASIIVVRFLPKEDYGLYVGAYNKYSYFATFVGMGFATAVLQYCSENRSEQQKNAIYRFALLRGTLFNAVLSLGIVLLGFAMARDGKGPYLTQMCLYPFFLFFFYFYRNVLRVKLDNRGYALICMSNALALCVGNIVFTRLIGASGYILSMYLSYAVAVFVGTRLVRRYSFHTQLKTDCAPLNPAEKTELTKYSLMCASTLFVTVVLGLLDITCLEFIKNDPRVLADYKVALAIPAALQTVTECLSTYYYPLLVKAYSDGLDEFRGMIKGCVIVFVLVSFVMSLLAYLLAPTIISLIYGAKYSGVVPIFRLLCIHLFISAGIHKFFGNIIMAAKKVNASFLFALLSVILNIVLNFILIRLYDSKGAAIATVIVTFFITLLEGLFIYLKLLRKRDAYEQPKQA